MGDLAIRPPDAPAVEAIYGLLDRVRGTEGFSIGLDDYLRVGSLVGALESDPSTPISLRAIALHVGPAVCKNESEQRRFAELVDDLFAEPSGQPAKLAPTQEPVLFHTAARWLETVRLAVTALAALAAIGLGVLVALSPGDGSTGLKGDTNVPAADTPVQLWPFLSGDILTTFMYVLLAVPILVAVVFVFRSVNRARALRQQALTEPSSRPATRFGLALDEATPVLGKVPWRSVATLLRRHEELAVGTTLDVRRSIRATMAAAGYPTPVHATRARSPEYLLFTRDTHPLSHLDGVGAEIADRLAGEQLAVERFRFWRGTDALIPVRRATAREREPVATTLNLDDLASRFPSGRVILVDDPAHLIDPVTREPQAWAQVFVAWPRKVLLTPVAPPRDDDSIAALAELGFVVVPLGAPDAFDCLMRVFADEGPPAPSRTGEEARGGHEPSLPPSLAAVRRHALATREPSEAQTTTLLKALHDYLGAPGLRWLQICAIFPRLLPPLTRHFGYRYADAAGKRLFTTRTYLRLARLPWFQTGTMPLWLRRELLTGTAATAARSRSDVLSPLPVTLQQEIRADLIFRMLKDRPGEPDVTLEVVRQDSDALGRKLATTLQRESRAGSMMADPLVIDFLKGRRADETDLTFVERARRRYVNHTQLREHAGSILGAIVLSLLLYFLRNDIVDWLVAAAQWLARLQRSIANADMPRDILIDLAWGSLTLCVATQLVCAGSWLSELFRGSGRMRLIWRLAPMVTGAAGIAGLAYASASLAASAKQWEPTWHMVHIGIGTCAALALLAFVPPVSNFHVAPDIGRRVLVGSRPWRVVYLFVVVWLGSWALMRSGLGPVPYGWMDRLLPMVALWQSVFAAFVLQHYWRDMLQPSSHRSLLGMEVAPLLLRTAVPLALLSATFSALWLAGEIAAGRPDKSSAGPLSLERPSIAVSFMPDIATILIFGMAIAAITFWARPQLWFELRIRLLVGITVLMRTDRANLTIVHLAQVAWTAWQRFTDSAILRVGLLMLVTWFALREYPVAGVAPEQIEAVVVAMLAPSAVLYLFVGSSPLLVRDHGGWRLTTVALDLTGCLVLLLCAAGVAWLAAAADMTFTDFGAQRSPVADIDVAFVVKFIAAQAPTLFALRVGMAWLSLRRHVLAEERPLPAVGAGPGAGSILALGALPVLLPLGLVASVLLMTTYALSPNVLIDFHWLVIPLAAWLGRVFGATGVRWMLAIAVMMCVGYATGPWTKPLTPGLALVCLGVASWTAGERRWPLSFLSTTFQSTPLWPIVILVCLIGSSIEIAYAGLAFGWKGADLAYVLAFIAGLSGLRPRRWWFAIAAPVALLAATLLFKLIGAIGLFRIGDATLELQFFPQTLRAAGSIIALYVLGRALLYAARRDGTPAETVRVGVEVEAGTAFRFALGSNIETTLAGLIVAASVLGNVYSPRITGSFLEGQVIGLTSQAGLIAALVMGWLSARHGVLQVGVLGVGFGVLSPLIVDALFPGLLSMSYGRGLTLFLCMIGFAALGAWLRAAPATNAAAPRDRTVSMA